MSDPRENGDHRRHRELLGAYALGLLDDAEAAELGRHLEGCEACRAEASELRAVAALLPEAEHGVATDPPPYLEDRVVDAVLPGARRARRERGGRGWAIGGLAAAAIVLVAVGLSLFSGGAFEGPPGLGEEEPIAFSGAPEGVSTEAAVVAHTWGTEVLLQIEGLEAGEVYAVRVGRSGGGSAPAGTFVGTGAEPVECALNGAVLRQDVRAVFVMDDSGEVVLRSELEPRPDLALSTP